jgi:hypothetical protein
MGYPVTPYDKTEINKKRIRTLPSYIQNLEDDEATITESFKWLTDTFKTQDAGKDSIKIKGVALRSDVTSRNGRKYIDEELQFAARTFVGKPLTVNHGDLNDKSNIIGHIDWCQYEDRALEYLATVKKQPYVDLIREGSTTIRGVSIEADYLKNPEQPYGIVGKALSIVLAPEEAGVPNTTIELVETANTVHRLFETVLKNHGLTYSAETTEQPTDDTTAPKESPVPYCAPDHVYNPTTGNCEPVADVAAKLDEISKQVTKEQLLHITGKILSFADKNVEWLKSNSQPNPNLLEAYQQATSSFKALTTAIDSILTQHQNNLKETAQITKRLEAVETKQDNLIHSLKGSFKQSHIRESHEESEEPSDSLPYGQG